MALLAGVDVGSSRVRALIFTEAGDVVAEAAVPTPMRRDADGAWYPAEGLWQAVCQTLRQVARPGIAGVAVASLGEAAVPIDASGRPLGDAIAWFDPRPVEAAELEQRLGLDRIYAESGLRLDPTLGLCKLLWYRRHRPEAMARAKRWLNVADYIAFRLSGVAATDFSLASRTLALDLHGRRWNEALLAELGIDPALFAPLTASGTPLGPVTAAETGLPPAAVVGVGGHDHICGAFAAGALAPGTLLDSLGTAEVLFVTTERPTADPNAASHGFAQGAIQVDRPRHYLLGGLFTSGAAIEWFRQAFAPGEPHETLIAEAAAVPPGSGGVMFLPHLRGGFTPWPDARSRGAFVGLTADVGRGALFRAVLEGLALEARATFDAMATVPEFDTPWSIRAIGGNVRNELFLQIKAAAFAYPVEAAALPETTSLGAALFAGLAAGVFADADAAVAAVARPGRVIDPDTAAMQLYQQLYEQAYRPAYQALRPLSHALGSLSTQSS